MTIFNPDLSFEGQADLQDTREDSSNAFTPPPEVQVSCDIVSVSAVSTFDMGVSTTMSASFIYPPRGNFAATNNRLPINARDTLLFQYESSFEKLNWTLFCSHPNAGQGYIRAAANDRPANDTYEFGLDSDRELGV